MATTIPHESVAANKPTIVTLSALIRIVSDVTALILGGLYTYLTFQSHKTREEVDNKSFVMFVEPVVSFVLTVGFIFVYLVETAVVMRDGGSYVKTTVAYNQQSRAILGLIAYSTALLLLSVMSSTAAISSSAQHTQPIVVASTAIKSIFGNRSVELYTIGGIILYHVTDRRFGLYFPCSDTKTGQDTLSFLDDVISLPMNVMALIALYFATSYQSLSSSSSLASFLVSFVEKNASFAFEKQFIFQVVTGWMMYKIGRMAFTYMNLTSLLVASGDSDSGLPSDSKLAESMTSSPFIAKSIDNGTGHKNVWRIYGNEYDCTEFVNEHPGGREAILLGVNRDDCTAIFQAYHAFTVTKARKVLERYRINDSIQAKSNSVPKSSTGGHENDEFYNILVDRVSTVLKENNIDPIRDRGATVERLFIFALLIILTSISYFYHCKGSVLGSISLGFVTWVLAAYGHDGGHFAVFRNPTLNHVASWCITTISNPVIWQIRHTYAHHSYTNDNEHDPDLNAEGFFRFFKDQKGRRKASRNQGNVVYVFFLYSLSTLAGIYSQTVRFVATREIHDFAKWTGRNRPEQTIEYIFHCALYSVLLFLVPMLQLESVYHAIACGLLYGSTSGALFGIFSQVGHVTEDALGRDSAQASMKRHPIAQKSWAAEQVETTNDFCPQSYFWYIVGGALGTQIEHHLFPGLNQCHLRMIQPTVERTCKEYNVHYKAFESFTDAVVANLDYLRTMATV